MINFIILLLTACSSILLGGFIVKFTIDEVKGKEWALRVIIGAFCLFISLLVLYACSDSLINFLIGYALGYFTLMIASKFSKLGYVDFALVSGALMSSSYLLNVSAGLLIIISLCVMNLPFGSLVTLEFKRKKWFKRLLLIDLVLAVTAFVTYQLFNYYNDALITGIIGGLFTVYGFSFIKGKKS